MTAKVAPEQQVMDILADPKLLGTYDEVLVQQTKKGCLQELMGCEANNEFYILPNETAKKEEMIMYSLEESTCCCRFFCSNNRRSKQTVWEGTKEDHKGVVMTMQRPLACKMQPCTCCNFWPFMQSMQFGEIGKADIPCFLCIPNIKVKDETGTVHYQVQMPSCCGGMCIDCMAEGCCNCKIPFYIYPPDAKARDKNSQVGKIVKVWRGLGAEIFTDAASFKVEFPKGIDEKMKARILGTTFFINMLWFEKQK